MSIQAMKAYADQLESLRIGYDQGDRWSFNPNRDGQTIIADREGDCSSTCAAIFRAGGVNLDTSDPMYTGNFREKAVAAGCTAINVQGKGVWAIVSMLQPGDCLLGPGHIVFVYSPTRWWSAENDEYRRSSGGRAGDQTGFEARFRGPYARSRGWHYILRPPNTEIVVNVLPGSDGGRIEGAEPRRIDWRNRDGGWVRIVQEIVGSATDGIFGPRTKAAVQALQRRLSVGADGDFGPATAEAYLLSVPNLYKGRGGMPSGAVKLLQWIVRSRVDGQFGDLTEADVKAAQVWAGLDADGNAGDETKRRITI